MSDGQIPEHAGGPALWKRDPRVALDQLFLSRKYGIGAFTITRNASAFIKNLTYVLDNNRPHPNSLNIHDHNDTLPRGNELSDDEGLSLLNFTVVRNPVDRFFSFYFSRLVGREQYKYEWIHDAVKADGGPEMRPISLEEHRRYCAFLVRWVERSLQGQVDEKPNPLWMPQRVRVNTARSIRAKVLTVEGLNDQLYMLLANRVPEIEDKLRATPRPRHQDRLFAQEELETDEILEHLHRIYAYDLEIWNRAIVAWEAVDMSSPNESHVPVLGPRLT